MAGTDTAGDAAGQAAVTRALVRLGLLHDDEAPGFTRLAGGVSSDIWRVHLVSGPVCVKRALPKLRVEQDWFAPVERNAYEAAWMRFAAAVVPEAVPRLLGQDDAAGVLVMAYLDPASHRLWKADLREGHADPEVARAVGDRLVRIHAASANDPDVAAAFATDRIFYDIRLEPYLVASARAHPDRADALHALVETTARNRRALVHGDVSPKNILIGPQRTGLPRCGMRLVRRPGVRPRVLPESPAAEMSVDAARRARASPVLTTCWPSPTSAASTGSRGARSRPVPPACSRAVPCADRRQVAGRVPDRGRRQGTRAPEWPAPCSPRRSSGSRTCAPPGRGSSGFERRDAHRPGARAAGVGLPRPADCRGGGGARRRCLRPRDRPGRRLDRLGRGLGRRDGGAAFGGYDVLGAVAAVNEEIAPALLGLDAADQDAVDRRLIELDGTPDKSRLGANATIAVSMAVAHAAAAAAGEPLWRHLRPERAALPLPEIQIFGGGAHAGRRVDIQDFMVVCPGAATFAQALDWTAEVYRVAGALMAEAGRLKGVADEGGYWPDFATNEEALEMLLRAIERAGLRPGEQVAIALDVAASEFGRGGIYKLGLEGRELHSEGMIDLLLGWLERYPIVSIEDPLAEDDPDGFAAFTRASAGAARWWPTTSP